jgi:hypothetical protein
VKLSRFFQSFHVASELKEAKEELEQHMKEARQNKGSGPGNRKK